MNNRPQECAASGAEHRDGPNGPDGETQCAYCGQPPIGYTDEEVAALNEEAEAEAFVAAEVAACSEYLAREWPDTPMTSETRAIVQSAWIERAQRARDERDRLISAHAYELEERDDASR
jgi:hypothetical protein